jgi:hypothetical protein
MIRNEKRQQAHAAREQQRGIRREAWLHLTRRRLRRPAGYFFAAGFGAGSTEIATASR